MGSRYERNEKKRRKARKKKKRKFLKKLGIFLLFLLIFLLIWGKSIEPNLLTTNDYRITENSLPDSFDGVKIVHFSDVHYGTGFTENRLKKLTNEINSLKPDIVVFTGDLIDQKYQTTESDIKNIVKHLNKIEANLGKYAVIGNHDFYNEDFENIMYDSEFIILKNNYDTVYNRTNQPIVIYGLDNITYGVPKPEIFNDKETNDIKYKIVLLHEPDYTNEFVNNYDINLVLAGHSHNGQVKLPVVKPFYLPNGSKEYYNGYYKLNNTDLYVSNGVGNSIYDFRLFTPPSINLYRLNTN